MTNLTPELIYNEFIENGSTFEAVAEKYEIPLDKLEAYCFSLCKERPDKFELKHFITRHWLETKLSELGSLIAVSNYTGIHYRKLHYLRTKLLPEGTRSLSDELSRDTLWRLYVEQELTDKVIADMYGTKTANIKHLRQVYDIMASDRKPLEEKLPIELFHRLYVISKLGLGQIASLYNSSRVTITQLKTRYAEAGHPLSEEIANTNNMGYYPRFMEELLQLISKEDLCNELRTKTVFEVAARYKLIAPTANSLIPLSKEWFKAELLTKSVNTIAKENNMTPGRVSVLLSEYGLDNPARTGRISRELLHELFVNRCWSDEKIAKHLSIAAGTIKRLRFQYRILSEQRPSVEERIPPALFRYLYIEEKMNLLQIAAAFDIAGSKIRELRKKYIADGYTEFAHRTSIHIQPERLEYLNKQIHLNLLKK